MAGPVIRSPSQAPLFNIRPQTRVRAAAPLVETALQKTLFGIWKERASNKDAEAGNPASEWKRRILGETNPQAIADAIYEAARNKDAAAIPAMIALIGYPDGNSREALETGMPVEEPMQTKARKTASAIWGEANRTRNTEGDEPLHNEMPPSCIPTVIGETENARMAFERNALGEKRMVAAPLYSHCANAICNIILKGREPLSEEAVEELIRISEETANPEVSASIYWLFGNLGENRAVPALLNAVQEYACNMHREEIIYRMARSSLLQTEIYHSTGLEEIEGPAIFEEAFARGKDLDVDRGITESMDCLCRFPESKADAAASALVALRLIGDLRAIEAP